MSADVGTNLVFMPDFDLPAHLDPGSCPVAAMSREWCFLWTR